MVTQIRKPAWHHRAIAAAARHPRMLHLASAALLCLSLAGLALAVLPDLAQGAGSDGNIPAAPVPTINRAHPTFGEDFNTLRLQAQGGPWRTSFDYAGIAAYTLPSNGEKQLYVDRTFRGTAQAPLGLDPFKIDGGMLTITAAPVNADLPGKMWGYRYASGLLSTKGRFSQRYGYFEIRAKLSAAPALWPAFWLLPADGSWPPEIDVFEQLGREPAKIYMSTVSRPADRRAPVYTHATANIPTAATAFHTYGLLWTARWLAFYIDGREISRTATPPEMHRPMYLLVNLAVGGAWAHDPDPAHPVTGSIAIDYIRVYPLAANAGSPAS